MTTIRRTVFLLLALAAGAAFAQSGAPANADYPRAAGGPPSPEQQQRMAERMAERFKTADADHDGKLTLDEARAGFPMVARNFDKIDTGHTGSLTLEQITAAGARMRRNRSQ